MRLIYIKTITNSSLPNYAGVSVSKRNFKKAVDRNRIKRLLREGYRKNKYLVRHNTSHQFTFMLLFIRILGLFLLTIDLIAPFLIASVTNL